jgi:hypothetical protein
VLLTPREVRVFSSRDFVAVHTRSFEPHAKVIDPCCAHLFFQFVARRYEKGSILITTNQVVTQWGTVFGDEVLMIQGESYRLKQKRRRACWAEKSVGGLTGVSA